ncbi:hypothetical protein V6N12_055424 [Hibiscus sabdariffa]|uniref:RNase H type-1 domain-containing protein n=1 Tax=Hibiscus sabdariffa TaxID=183260 RepID=A0ABR2BU01_9ROSI
MGWWIKAKQPSLLLSIDEFLVDPILMEERLLNVEVLVTHSVWQPPPVGWLKFNVDKALEAGRNVGGIGGVLRNECGQHLLTFSIRVGLRVPIMSENLAVFYDIWLFMKYEFLAGFL